MTFKFAFRVDREGMTVPYAPITDDIRRNRGFVDLRGRSDLAGEIAEGHNSVALRNLLVRIAQPSSRVFTIGCDLGAHQQGASATPRSCGRIHRTPNHATVGDFRVVDFSIKAGAQPRGFPRAASRSRWRDGFTPSLVSWLAAASRRRCRDQQGAHLCRATVQN
jgi:hypothetical protein